jgi:predicted transcriptional regulator
MQMERLLRFKVSHKPINSQKHTDNITENGFFIANDLQTQSKRLNKAEINEICIDNFPIVEKNKEIQLAERITAVEFYYNYFFNKE